MRIVIDLQSCQSGSRKGGIGRYSLALAKEMFRQSRGHDFWVVLNNLFPEQIIEVRAELIDLLPPDRIKTFNVHGPVHESVEANWPRFGVAARMREHFIESLRPDFVHVSSLFEGLYEETVTSVGLIGDPERTAVTLYDLIPLVEREKYLGWKVALDFFMTKIAYLKKAGLALAISEFSREEALDLIGLPSSRVVNISSAISPFFRKIDIAFDEAQHLKQKLGIRNKFVMYTSSYDQRKNQEGLIRGFSTIPESKRKEYQIVFVGNGGDDIYSQLRNIGIECGLDAVDIVFPGFITDEELRQLYNLTSLLVFPSLREGFGLPILEAMACGAPAIGSNTTSIPEVIGRSDALFDPASAESIGKKIHQALFDEGFRHSLKEHAIPQAAKFSWERSANTALDAIEHHAEQLHGQARINAADNGFTEAWAQIFESKRLYNEIAQVSKVEQLTDSCLTSISRCLAKNAASTEAVLRSDFQARSPARVAWITTWNTRCGIAASSIPVIEHVRCCNWIFAPKSADLVGQDEENVVRCWESGAGDLSDLITATNAIEPDAVVIQFNYGFFEFGQLARVINNHADKGRSVFMIMHSTQDPPREALDRQLDQIRNELQRCRLYVHTKGDLDRLALLGLAENVQLIPLGIHEDQFVRPNTVPAPEGRRVIATYGFALPNKGLVELVEAFALVVQKFKDLHLLFVTAEFLESTKVSARYIQQVQNRILECGLGDRVTMVTDYLSNSESLSLLSCADLIVIPYQNTSESSSASARMALVSGRPVAVTPSPIFDDMRDAVYTLPGMSATDIAEGVINILGAIGANLPSSQEKVENAAAWIRAHGSNGVGQHIFSEILVALESH